MGRTSRIITATRKSSDIADPSLAKAGEGRIAWAETQMPVLRGVRERFAREKPLDGVKIAASLHVTAETANLVRTLTAGGAVIGLCASNPLSTQDDTAAALAKDAAVFARAGEDPETYYRHIDAVLDTRPRLTIDDGADLVGVLHGQRTDLLEGILGGTEETTTGIIRLRALEAQGKLAFPVIAVAESVTGRKLDHTYGTGQSTLDGILRATNILIAGQRVVLVGYGACGRGAGRRGPGGGEPRPRARCPRDRVRGRRAQGARGGDGRLRRDARARRGPRGRRVRHRHRRPRRRPPRALRADARRRDRRERRPLRRRDLEARPERAHEGAPRGASARGAAHARGWPPHPPAGRRTRGEPRRG